MPPTPSPLPALTTCLALPHNTCPDDQRHHRPKSQRCCRTLCPAGAPSAIKTRTTRASTESPHVSPRPPRTNVHFPGAKPSPLLEHNLAAPLSQRHSSLAVRGTPSQSPACTRIRCALIMSESRGTVTIKEHFCFYNISPYRFELRFYNVTSAPKNPTHPCLLKKNWQVRHGDPPPFPLEKDGTYGDRDWLFTTFPLLRNRVWIHYIPTPSMWAQPPIKGLNYAPIFIMLDETNDRTWMKVSRDSGFVLRPLRKGLKWFLEDGILLANKLLVGATKWATLPLPDTPLTFDGLEKTAPFAEMCRRFHNMQCLVAELWGWVFLQGKLQGWTIVPRSLLLDMVIKLDYFRGVIIPWDEGNSDLAQMLLRHGVPTVWIDYIDDPKARQALWEGLPGRGHEAQILHRGSGYDNIENDGDTRSKVYSLEFKTVDGATDKVAKVFAKESEATTPAPLPGPSMSTSGASGLMSGVRVSTIPNLRPSTPTIPPAPLIPTAAPAVQISLVAPTASQATTTPAAAAIIVVPQLFVPYAPTGNSQPAVGSTYPGAPGNPHVGGPYYAGALAWTYGNGWPGSAYGAPSYTPYGPPSTWGSYSSQFASPPTMQHGPFGYPGASAPAYGPAPAWASAPQPAVSAGGPPSAERQKASGPHRHKQRRRKGMNPTSAEHMALKAKQSADSTDKTVSTPEQSPISSVTPLGEAVELSASGPKHAVITSCKVSMVVVEVRHTHVSSSTKSSVHTTRETAIPIVDQAPSAPVASSDKALGEEEEEDPPREPSCATSYLHQFQAQMDHFLRELVMLEITCDVYLAWSSITDINPSTAWSNGSGVILLRHLRLPWVQYTMSATTGIAVLHIVIR
ncbi:hypothetical protein BOTBODRAFT_181519 [Botryobasidium botryosum FD-172 SS1]|uniref:Uncharacterized protein n=1 Tax=Botryobasidium botryosum (strain FD-172 SS1) TaxID=930990 RepID=A0A067LT88_BOTB1|nr:hypothetical protein BOTBODRAFT_181519 [Botryobasidium botryosum FD-172 SS1]